MSDWYDDDFYDDECGECVCATCRESCDLCPMWPDHSCPRYRCLKHSKEDD